MESREAHVELSKRTFDRVRKLVYHAAGIDLRPGKESMVSARLGRLMRTTGLQTYEECLDQVESDTTGRMLVGLIDALTTNYTYFLREPAHFDFMAKEILPRIAQRGRIEIWCAAAATGEEPYSIAFTLLETLGTGAAAHSRILATDISVRALTAARTGVYPADRFRNVPAAWLPKYLLRGEGSSSGLYKIKPEVGRVVEFRRLNLVEPFQPGAVFPLISCRNVMIYFDKPTQERIVNRLAMFLEPGGYLFVGLSESLNGMSHPLEYVRPSIYRKALSR
jgi:chemotaxis protein methyltransferase CheR